MTIEEQIKDVKDKMAVIDFTGGNDAVNEVKNIFSKIDPKEKVTIFTAIIKEVDSMNALGVIKNAFSTDQDLTKEDKMTLFSCSIRVDFTENAKKTPTATNNISDEAKKVVITPRKRVAVNVFAPA